MGIFTSQETISRLASKPVPPTAFWFKTRPGVNVGDASRALQRTFYESGMNTIVIEDNIRTSMRAMSMINNLLTGFMGLGLVVGIAALGVIAARAVVERRQQIACCGRSASAGGWFKRHSCWSHRSWLCSA